VSDLVGGMMIRRRDYREVRVCTTCSGRDSGLDRLLARALDTAEYMMMWPQTSLEADASTAIGGLV
jgi:hypothetical protein